MGGTIIDAQGARSTSDIDTKGFPRERLLEDALTEVGCEKESVGRPCPSRLPNGPPRQPPHGGLPQLSMDDDGSVPWGTPAQGGSSPPRAIIGVRSLNAD